MGDWTLTFKNLVFPIFCSSCGLRLLTEENGYFCPTCWESSPRIERPFCSVCGRPHPIVVGLGSQRNFPCAECSAGATTYPFRMMRGAMRYEDAIANAIQLYKFNGKERLAAPLAERMAEFAEQELDVASYDVLTPVPLHKVRERERGFNQSRLLAQHLDSVFPNARIDESLRRIRPTRVQSRLTCPRERRANVRGAFSVEPNGCFNGATVLLIDDVVTTGGTVTECAEVLLAAGAATVDVFVAALTVKGMNPKTN